MKQALLITQNLKLMLKLLQDAVPSQSVSGSLSWAAKTTLYPKWIEIAFD